MDRHLLPEEIDQLLDGEVGFGTAPLKAHVRACAACRAELDSARVLVRELEHLPHFAPAVGFSDRVMAQVQVFVPWHVALLDAVRGWLPRSRAGRAVAWAGLGSIATVLTVISLWLITRLDTVVFAADLGLERVRAVTVGALSDAAAALFGDAAVQALRAGGTAGVMLALLVLLLSAALAARALRAIVAGARRR
ncbi:MAG TPA: hypothetical protein VFS44_02735 [Gemmatimonadaceae bacterium]|nr:hypothetical protein [Gemmatimonadaceae bacterium]